MSVPEASRRALTELGCCKALPIPQFFPPKLQFCLQTAAVQSGGRHVRRHGIGDGPDAPT